jgi:hypothetical protein
MTPDGVSQNVAVRRIVSDYPRARRLVEWSLGLELVVSLGSALAVYPWVNAQVGAPWLAGLVLAGALVINGCLAVLGRELIHAFLDVVDAFVKEKGGQ